MASKDKDMPGKADGGFMSIKAAQDYLGVGETTIHRLMNQKKLTKYKVGSRTLLKRSEVEAVAKPA
jgi:excisionase family DNA binding protein